MEQHEAHCSVRSICSILLNVFIFLNVSVLFLLIYCSLCSNWLIFVFPFSRLMEIAQFDQFARCVQFVQCVRVVLLGVCSTQFIYFILLFLFSRLNTYNGRYLLVSCLFILLFGISWTIIILFKIPKKKKR